MSLPTLAGRVLLAAILVWAVGSLAVSASFLWTERGTVGLTANYSGKITDVAAGSPAAAAGIVRGDRIDLRDTPRDARPRLVGATTAYPPKTAITVAVHHGTSLRTVTLQAAAQPVSPAERASLFVSLLAASIFIVVGALLIFLRPSSVAWGFGLFCILNNPIVPSLSRFPSFGAHLAYVSIYDIAQNAGLVGLLVFALNFPHTLKLRWRELLVRALAPIFIVLSAWTLWIDLAVCVFAVPSQSANIALQVAFGLVDALTIFLVTETYVRGPRVNRPRLRWVLVGFYVGLVCNYVGNVLIYTANVALPGWVDSLLVATEVFLPLTVAYAIVRHRVIEIDIFFSRALVYALFTSLLAVVFGAIDWIGGRLVEDFRLSIAIEACISVALAIAFDRIRGLLELVAERIVFRARRIATDRLERTSRTFRFVGQPASVDDSVVGEAHDALEIVSVALFRREGDAYHRACARGWTNGSCESLSADDRLVLEHEAREGALHLSEIPWHRDDVPHGLAEPVLSIPLRDAQHVRALLLCSRMRNGEDLDGEAIQLLAAFANAAAVAYERLDASEMRAAITNLREQIAILSARLDEARRA